jgi:hypothetical protein
MQTYGLLIFRNLTPFALWADLVRRAKKQVQTALKKLFGIALDYRANEGFKSF